MHGDSTTTRRLAEDALPSEPPDPREWERLLADSPDNGNGRHARGLEALRDLDPDGWYDPSEMGW